MAEGTGGNRDERRIGAVTIRPAVPDDASAIITLVAENPAAHDIPGFEVLDSAANVSRMMQTGHRLLVAESDGAVCGLVRWHEDEGIAWFDLLLSSRAGAGRALVHFVAMRAQEGGIRLVRCRAPEDRLADYFGWLGYFPVSRETVDEVPMLVLERRLPLLTVREQRREDAEFIAAMTGRDSYPFEIGARPGWFITADGDRTVGVVWVSDAGGGDAEIGTPILFDAYRGRGLETWMLERAVFHAQHAGFHTARVAADDWLRELRRELEDHQWFLENGVYLRRLSAPRAENPDW